MPSVEETTRLARRGAAAAIASHHALGHPVVIEEDGEVLDWMPDGRKLPHDPARYAAADAADAADAAERSDAEPR